MNYTILNEYVLNMLNEKLDKRYVYHNIQHIEDVVRCVEAMCDTENLGTEEVCLLKTAALLHDVGYIERYHDNEQYAANFARNELPAFGYSASQADYIARLILKTKMPFHPENISEMIICDADLDYLGTEKYYFRSMQLFCEWNAIGMNLSLHKWFLLQYDFLTNHQYFTQFSLSKREPFKQTIIQDIKEILKI